MHGETVKFTVKGVYSQITVYSILHIYLHNFAYSEAWEANSSFPNVISAQIINYVIFN